MNIVKMKMGTDIGSSYRSDKQCCTFTKFIAEVERKKLVEKYNRSNSVSLIIDGSTDSSVTEQELLYIRTCDKGIPETHFLTICAMGKATAENIYNKVIPAICMELDTTSEIFMKKLAGLGTDGAAVMQGKNSGLVARMKAIQPCMVGIHCMAHRLELAFKSTVKEVIVFQEIDQLLLDLYLFYHYSPLNRSLLKEAYKSLDLGVLVPTRVGGTRWVGHELKALEHMFRGYEAITTHMSNITR